MPKNTSATTRRRSSSSAGGLVVLRKIVPLYTLIEIVHCKLTESLLQEHLARKLTYLRVNCIGRSVGRAFRSK